MLGKKIKFKVQSSLRGIYDLGIQRKMGEKFFRKIERKEVLDDNCNFTVLIQKEF